MAFMLTIRRAPLPNPFPKERGFRIQETHSNKSPKSASLSFGEGWGGEPAPPNFRLRDPNLTPQDGG